MVPTPLLTGKLDSDQLQNIQNGHIYTDPMEYGDIPTKRRFSPSTLAAVCFSGAALIIAIGTCTFVTLTVLNKNTQANQAILMQTKEAEHRPAPLFTCIPCKDLQMDPNDDIFSDPLLNQLDIEVDNQGRHNCCAYSAQQKTALFESIVRLQGSKRSPLPRFNVTEFRFSPVTAHMRLYSQKKLHGKSKNPQIMELQPSHDDLYGLEHHRNVHVGRRGLEIIHAGLYYVYSSIQFKPQANLLCSSFKYQTFAAYIEKVSNRQHTCEQILKCVQTCCYECEAAEETQYTGGIFYLESKDQIRVKIYGEKLTGFTPESSFLGLAMLGGPGIEEGPVIE